MDAGTAFGEESSDGTIGGAGLRATSVSPKCSETIIAPSDIWAAGGQSQDFGIKVRAAVMSSTAMPTWAILGLEIRGASGGYHTARHGPRGEAQVSGIERDRQRMSSSNVTHVTDDSFNAQWSSRRALTLVDFWAAWCHVLFVAMRPPSIQLADELVGG
jgi:hypothetical protein